MMKDHKVSRLRLLGGAVAVTLLTGVSAALGSPGFAHPHEDKQEQTGSRENRRERVIIRTHRVGEGEQREHAEGTRHSGHREHANHDRRVIVRTHRGDSHQAAPGGHGDQAPHVFHMRQGPGVHLAMAECDEDQRTEVSEGEGNERTRVILCSRGEADPAQRAERLQRVRDRLAEESELSAEQRARVSAALDREIARLRGN